MSITHAQGNYVSQPSGNSSPFEASRSRGLRKTRSRASKSNSPISSDTQAGPMTVEELKLMTMHRKSARLSVNALAFVPSQGATATVTVAVNGVAPCRRVNHNQTSQTQMHIKTIPLPRTISMEEDEPDTYPPVIIKDVDYDDDDATSVSGGTVYSADGAISNPGSNSGNSFSFGDDNSDFHYITDAMSSEYTESVGGSSFSSLCGSPSPPYSVGIIYDPETDLPLFKNPTSGQMILFLATAKNLPKGYETAFLTPL